MNTRYTDTIVRTAAIALCMLATHSAWPAPAEPPDYCTTGHNQSPVHIQRPTEAVLEQLFFTHSLSERTLTLTEGENRLTFPTGSSINVDHEQFHLGEMSVRSPSEHRIEGKVFELELQLAYQTESGQRLNIALMFNEGTENQVLQELLTDIRSGQFRSRFDPQPLLSIHGGYYRYSGSLTKPPCTEGIRWIIEAKPQHASASQIRQFRELFAPEASRATQPLNARLVLK